jgi:hypothetical protein
MNVKQHENAAIIAHRRDVRWEGVLANRPMNSGRRPYCDQECAAIKSTAAHLRLGEAEQKWL